MNQEPSRATGNGNPPPSGGARKANYDADLDGPTPAQQRAAAIAVSDAALRLAPTREQAADDPRQVLDTLGLTEGARP